ncbi:hypothetical protein E2P86_09935 [Sphingobacterium psychroaquaticum]|uniref:hypothetical protein n=1 Tax=Sphingobacterium psychroaquaticum TaxID=561061 RepID=UPI00106CE7EA|nr:hypothetical protein [Sphingobacterium psychroaquaticum]QBQ41457.1 hypothetical protein E2P86_09935 [Sphingobacterium psychroaquaticum]
MKKLLFVFFSLFLLFSCSSEDDNLKVQPEQELNETEVIAILSSSMHELKSRKFLLYESNDKIDIKEQYKLNLEYLKSRTGVDLEYNDDEFDNMLSIFQGDLTSDFKINEEKVKKYKDELYKSGKKEVYDKSLKILNIVYANDPSNSIISPRISWGCGLAIASNVGATLGLTACVTGVGCPLAVAMKALALVAVVEAC